METFNALYAMSRLAGLSFVAVAGKPMQWAEGCVQILLLTVGVVAAFNALAQPRLVVTPPAAFNTMKRPIGECVRDSVIPFPMPSSLKVGDVRPDLSCAIAPAELTGLLKRPDTVMADVRPAADFAAAHIDGAMNLTAAELRTKQFLKPKTVVLIGSGKAERERYLDCARLKASGFQHTKVLRGGMPAWLSSGQAILGRTPDAANMGLLSPGELWAETRFNANLVLLTANSKGLSHEWPSATTIPDVSLAAVQAAIRQRGNKSPLASVVLVTADGKVAASLPSLRQAIQPVPLLAYTGSADAYTRQLAQQQAVWDAQARGPKKPRCGS